MYVFFHGQYLLGIGGEERKVKCKLSKVLACFEEFYIIYFIYFPKLRFLKFAIVIFY